MAAATLGQDAYRRMRKISVKIRCHPGGDSLDWPRMFSPVDTKDPTAVANEVGAAYLAIFPAGDQQFVLRAFDWTIACFSGNYRDYQPIDARYHDLEHTLQGTLCLARLLRGRHHAGGQPVLSERITQLGLLAMLLHDTGYLKQRDDTEGTGAKYTLTHVKRSTEFAAGLLAEMACQPADIQAVQNMIRCTGVDATLNVIQFQDAMEKTAGQALGTADLLGQMAAEDYIEKLPVLYSEFEEAARHTPDRTNMLGMFSSAADLMRKAPVFWEKYVTLKLNRDFEGLHRFLNYPYPDGPNYYFERIELNMDRLRQQLERAEA